MLLQFSREGFNQRAVIRNVMSATVDYDGIIHHRLRGGAETGVSVGIFFNAPPARAP